MQIMAVWSIGSFCPLHSCVIHAIFLQEYLSQIGHLLPLDYWMLICIT